MNRDVQQNILHRMHTEMNSQTSTNKELRVASHNFLSNIQIHKLVHKMFLLIFSTWTQFMNYSEHKSSMLSSNNVKIPLFSS